MQPDPVLLRAGLERARLMLVFTPEVCGANEPLSALEAALPHLDAIQVRPKTPGSAALAPCAARDVHEWTLRVLELVHARRASHAIVIANDRVDVAKVLWSKGCAGVHLGQDDCPVDVARDVLGADAIVGVSTHDDGQVAAAIADARAVDYLGFGPIHATRTKGYAAGLGPAAYARARNASSLPVFAIGGIDRSNVASLGARARVAVGAAILAAEDPGHAAQAMRALLDRD